MNHWTESVKRHGMVGHGQGHWTVITCDCIRCGADQCVEVEIDITEQGAMPDPVQCSKCKQWMVVSYILTPTIYLEPLAPEDEPDDDTEVPTIGRLGEH